MALRLYKPTTPARRGMTSQDTAQLTKKRPTRALLKVHKPNVGRNNQGRITTRHRGGGVKRFYRQVDFKTHGGDTVTVESIEYDPNRSAHIALVRDEQDRPGYILHGVGVRVG